MDHDCEYKERVAFLEEELAKTQSVLQSKVAKFEAELAQLKKSLLGPKSEKMPRPIEQKPADPAVTKAKRAANKKARDAHVIVNKEEVLVADRSCPSCGDDVKSVGQKTSSIYEYVPAQFLKRVIERETVKCKSCDFITTADAPKRVLNQSKYGAGFAAHLCVNKVLDSIPVYRMEKQFKRMGVPMARSTMNELVMRSGKSLRLLGETILTEVAKQPIVLADETSLPVMKSKKCKRGFIWNFNAETEHGKLVGYRFSPDRSRQTPVDVLGSSKGVLLVDGYAGYNAVTTPEGRERAACLAHPRRKFFDAIQTSPVAEVAVRLIGDVYRVEHEALEKGIVRSEEHAELRRTKGRAAMNKFREWLDENASTAPPKSPLGRAINHTLKIWDRLCVFLDDVNVPIDNNASERYLRPVAKGRDNWMFAGNDEAAKNIATLWSLTTSCELNGINPWEYLTDVLLRVDEHPASRIEELLPDRWVPVDV